MRLCGANQYNELEEIQRLRRISSPLEEQGFKSESPLLKWLSKCHGTTIHKYMTL